MSAAAETPAGGVPPIPRFWTKYSANQEFPLSTVLAIALHVVAAALLLLLFQYVINVDRDPGMVIEGYGGDLNAGGGGDPGESASNSAAGGQRVEKATEDELPPAFAKSNVALGALPDPKSSLPDLPNEVNADRVFDIGKDARSKLDNLGKAPIEPRKSQPSKGNVGAGTGGGKGAGKGPGTGDGDGPGSQGSIRQRRNKRWTLTFDSAGGHDYLRQLSALGAILVADFPDGGVTLYRRLDQSPVPPEPFDPDVRQRMGWVDERPGAVRELAEAIGIQRAPSAIRAYFPFKLENELLKLELAYRGKKEDDIHSTIFKAVMEGKGYRIIVSEQRYN